MSRIEKLCLVEVMMLFFIVKWDKPVSSMSWAELLAVITALFFAVCFILWGGKK